jgi:hypothetical protein
MAGRRLQRKGAAVLICTRSAAAPIRCTRTFITARRSSVPGDGRDASALVVAAPGPVSPRCDSLRDTRPSLRHHRCILGTIAESGRCRNRLAVVCRKERRERLTQPRMHGPGPTTSGWICRPFWSSLFLLSIRTFSVFDPWYSFTKFAAESQRAAWLRMMDLAWGIGPRREPPSSRTQPAPPAAAAHPRPESKAAPAAERVLGEGRVSARPQEPAGKSPVKPGRKHRKHSGRRNSTRH